MKDKNPNFLCPIAQVPSVLLHEVSGCGSKELVRYCSSFFFPAPPCKAAVLWKGREGSMVQGPSVDTPESVAGHSLHHIFYLLWLRGHFVTITLLIWTLKTPNPSPSTPAPS